MSLLDEPLLPESRPSSLPRLDSTVRFHGEREVVIVHRGQEHRLRITRAREADPAIEKWEIAGGSRANYATRS